MKYENGSARLFDLNYTHIIRHYAQETTKRGKTKRGINNYFAANVRKTPTTIVYESENALNQVVTTVVPLGDVLDIKEIENEEKPE